ncbi:hypothetical protein Ancab_003899 [Ancistrocladus abbreviatus]
MVKVDEGVFPIRVVEEPFKTEDWSVENWEDNDGLCASPSSPSTSISTVLDSFGNIFVGEQQPVVVTSLKAVADFSNFKPEKNELAMPTPIDSRPTDGMEPVKGVFKSQGWEGSLERNSLLFLSGPERLNGGPPSIAQVRICNNAECSTGPGIRPEFMKITEDLQKEVVSVYSPSPGPTQ